MPRIQYAQEGQEAAGATEVYKQFKEGLGMVPNVVKLLGHSGAATQALGTILNIYYQQLGIDAKTREIAYLTVARFNDCDYCQGHHVPAGKQAGLTDDQIDQLGENGFDSSDFSAGERAIIRFAFETSRDVEASDEALEALKANYSLEQIAEIVFVVAAANFIQRVGKNLGAELEG
ncbi:MAG: carboxymuconolactone decarboxylase family protein [Xanthomonadaceae bacterium]|nr:carboxymuconolactone decarboxylase family protein [Xanthomonadaceae bacterium]